jgi:aminoglycoside phosphotransferase (APT) family kinase protein
VTTANFEIIKKLTGHSGCDVELYKDRQNYFIRKSSPAPSYAPRLVQQAEKQRRLASVIPVPAIVRTQFEMQPISFDMEFIPGLDFKQMCLSKPMSWISQFVEDICQHFAALQRSSIDTDLSPLFTNKLTSLQDVIYNHHSPQVRGLLTKLDRLLAYDFSAVPATESHGDLTLENIIFKGDGSVVFIDVLDGELQTFWLDIAKICYDLEISWSLRSSLWHPHHSPEERILSMIGRYLGDELQLALTQRFPDAIPHLPALKAVQALRVLPYSHNEQTVSKLSDYIASLPF